MTHHSEVEGLVEETRSAGNLKVANFHCSEHGYITPEPHCPKCFAALTSHHQKSIEAVVARLEDMKVDLFEYKKLLCHPTSGCNKTNRRINMHGKKQHNQALNDAITIIRDILKS